MKMEQRLWLKKWKIVIVVFAIAVGFAGATFCLHESLNRNQGTAMVVLTFVYAITTVCILWQARLIHEDETRPLVVFNFVSENRGVSSVRSNLGKRAAYDVRVRVVPAIEFQYVVGTRAPVSYENVIIPMLAPGQSVIDELGASHDFLKVNQGKTFDVSISYRDSFGRCYEERTSLSLEYVRHVVGGSQDRALREVARQVERICTAIQDLRAQVGNLNVNPTDQAAAKSPPRKSKSSGTAASSARSRARKSPSLGRTYLDEK